MNFESFIMPELSVLIPVLYLIGAAIKKSRIKDWLIPFILGAAGIVLSAVYLLSVSFPSNGNEALALVFSSITQGIICCATAVYTNNLVVQFGKRNQDDTAEK